MMRRLRQHITLLVAVVAVFGPMMFMHSCANTTQAPSGGKKDTIPPVIIGIRPYPGTTNVPVHNTKIYFEFNEYVTIKNAKNIVLSPPQQKPVKAKLHKRGIVVTFEEDLQPETTYTISFVDAVADNNEGNMFPGYTYAFSTGGQIDSMMLTGTVQDCNSLKPMKGATVLLYKNHADSAIFLERPYAVTKTDDWGFFVLPFIKDTTYRLYALKDDAGNNIYDPDADLVAFVDSLVRPTLVASDTMPEMLKYDMKDTLNCQARRSEHTLRMFREKPSKQFLKNKVRTGDYSAYVTFQAPNAWVDSIWVRGYKADQVISEFNILQDSLLIWLNGRKAAPDTMHLFVNYRKTDSLGHLKPELEHLKLIEENKSKKPKTRKDIKHEDTICVYKLNAVPETVEQNGFELSFDLPIINEGFDKLKFRYLNPRQKEFPGEVTMERDTLNLRRFVIRPKEKLMPGYEYYLKMPAHTFRDIRGFWNDSTEVKVSLPKDETLSTLNTVLKGVDRKIIVDLLSEKRDKVLRSYIIDSDCTLAFPYIKEGKYSIRITDDGNRNSIVDTGSLLEHRQPERVIFVKFNTKDAEYLDIPPSSEVEQNINVAELFND
ncbi:MAG: Ig-like domain-containing protein [Bacteroidales bacterium]|nr:Ig-like domain-containing protein [Candidatus Cryptobacteroides choladohippi]